MNTAQHSSRTAAVRVAAGLAATATLTASALTMVGSPAVAGGAGDPKHCDRGICLNYSRFVLEQTDADGDGFADADEEAAGTDPKDPSSHPTVLHVVDLVARGALPSFEKGFSEIVVVPTSLPDGTKVADMGSLESLTAALGGLAPSRTDGLARLGISSKLLGRMGVGGSDVLSIVAGLRTSKDQPAFEARIGGINASWISAGSSESGGSTYDYKDGETNHTVVSWFEQTDAGTVNYTVDFERCGTRCTGDVTVTVKGGGQDDQCSTVAGFGCFGSLGDVADKGYDKMKESEKKNGKDSGGQTPKPAESAQPAGQPSPGATGQPSQQPSGGSSGQPSQQPSAQPTATASSDPDDGEDEEEYTNPDADQTVVVIRPGDVERVVRLVRGSNTTPAQIDRELPELDPKDLSGGNPEIELRDPNWDGGSFTTVSPVRTGEANSNYGPDGGRGPRP